MNRLQSLPARRSGFTLIELLTVIAIIAILMGILFPVIRSVMNTARKTETKATEVAIINAVKSYQNEYGHYPDTAAAGQTPDTEPHDTFVGDAAAMGITDNNAHLFDTLRALSQGVNIDHQRNPRRVPYFEGRPAPNFDRPKSGFLEKAGQNGPDLVGSLFDPWGIQYGVGLDTNYDNSLDLTGKYDDFAPATRLQPKVGAVAFSTGVDLKLGDKGNNRYKNASGEVSDDVVSWQ